MTESPPRDVRVDRIGFVAELQRQYADELKSRLKLSMAEAGQERVEGDFFEGVLAESQRKIVEPAKLLALYERRQITRAQYLSAIAVVATPLAAFLSLGEISQMATIETSVALRVTRKKGVSVELVEALRGLRAAIAA